MKATLQGVLMRLMLVQVAAVWDELEARDYGWRGLPRYALGVSSGGAMAMVLAQSFTLQVRHASARSIPCSSFQSQNYHHSPVSLLR